jgi:glycosyltransferase involved in cell wall biosynthesis
MSRPIRVLELRSVRGTGGGPEKTILLGAARSDPARFAITVCYVRDDRDDVFSIDSKAGGLAIDYVELRERHSFDLSIWKTLRQLVRTRRIDIVHAHEYKTDLLALMLARFEGIAALSTVHGWTGHSPRERWLYYPFDKRLLARFPRLIAVSSDIRRELVRWGARDDRICTVPNGIDHRVFKRDRSREADVRRRLGLPPEAFVIGAVGRLEPQKRFDLLIDAIAQLRETQPQVVLLLVGDGSLKQTLAAQIAGRDLETRCIMLGQRPDVADLHHAFDLFVQSSDYEGTSNAVLEAMALETPLVATDAGGTSDIVRQHVDGLIISRGNTPFLADAIDRVIAHREAALARAASARRRVETDLSFDARMATVETVYTSLFEQRTALDDAPRMAARA